jgi:hypothetical protein
MQTWQGRRSLSVVTACMAADGKPTFALTEVTVTQDEYENGIHYYVTEGELLERGLEEPFVHYDELESPCFLHAAVREFLGLVTTHPSPDHLPLEQP